MAYVDGMVAAVPTANREKFKKHAEEAAENSALQIVECWGDDVPEGQVTSFPMAVKRKPDETVIFSWISGVAGGARQSHEGPHGRSAHATRHQSDAFRRQTHDLRRG